MYMLTRILFIFLILTVFFVTPTLASSWCSCEGEAEGVSLESSSKLNHERLVKIDPQKTKCKGHSCCPNLNTPLRIWFGEKSKSLRGYGSPVAFSGKHEDFIQITKGKKLIFKFSCSDSMTPQGVIGGNSFQVLQFID